MREEGNFFKGGMDGRTDDRREVKEQSDKSEKGDRSDRSDRSDKSDRLRDR